MKKSRVMRVRNLIFKLTIDAHDDLACSSLSGYNFKSTITQTPNRSKNFRILNGFLNVIKKYLSRQIRQVIQ